MTRLIRAISLVLLMAIASPALAQNLPPPEPLPLGTPYIYQVGNAYWYQPFTFNPSPYFAFSSPYPFGSRSNVFGLYSWDYGVYQPTAYGWYPYSIVVYPSVYRYPLPAGRVWIYGP